jgi:nitrous oxidase accessory protein
MIPFLRSVAILIPHGFLLSLTIVTSIFATDIVVPTDYLTIQTAIDRAKPNDTIIVEDGYYNENIEINKPLTLMSRNGHEKTVIEAKSSDEDVLKIVDVDGAAVLGFSVKGSTSVGIHLVRTTNSRISANNVTGNYDGISLEYSSNNALLENISDGNEQGIYLYYSDGNVLEHNSADNNADRGITLHASHSNTVQNNTADANYWNGITITSSHKNTVTDNRAVGNSYSIVMSDAEGNEMGSNTTMRRLYFILPVVLVYLGICLYLIEKRLLLLYFKNKST